jgi:hypothetical protein
MQTTPFRGLVLSLFALFVAPRALAETDYSDLISSRFISIGEDFKPVVTKNSATFNTNYNEDKATNKLYTIESNAKSPMKYKLKVNVRAGGASIDEAVQVTAKGANLKGDDASQLLSTSQFDASHNLVSFTNCEGQHDTYLWQLQTRRVHSCMTITPKMCNTLKGMSKNKDFKELMDSALTCFDIGKKMKQQLGTAFDDNYKKAEESNLLRLKGLSREVSPNTIAALLFKENPITHEEIGNGRDGAEASSSTALKAETAGSAMNMFEHVARAIRECAIKEKYFTSGNDAGLPVVPSAGPAASGAAAP